MMHLPRQFENKMKTLLGAEYEAFAASYAKPRRRGLRVNESKISVERFLRFSPFPLEPVPWVQNGFFYPGEVRPARHPYYAAGLYYLQEPSAMTPASRLPLAAGERVLDLCAAPGGKATELSARLAVLDGRAVSGAEQKPRGFLVANDISQQRARALLHNLEMTGTENFCVLNETPERLAAVFPQYFDKILVDAPCSGEGMFRKEEEALRLWSPERVADFAGQQRKILAEAYTMLRPGGMLLYSTCTFAPEENEQQIADFLQHHSDMELQEIEPYEGFSEGRPDWIRDGEQNGGRDFRELKRCVRIWPHRMDGEGHFLALMMKKNQNGAAYFEMRVPKGLRYGKEGSHKKKKSRESRSMGNRPGREQIRLLREFLCTVLGNTAFGSSTMEELCNRVEMRQEKAFLPGPVGEKLAGLHVIRGGIYLGDWKKNRFEPSQAWAMAWGSLKGRDSGGEDTEYAAYRRIPLEIGDMRLTRYLAGESFYVEKIPDGWALVCVDDFPIGWSKVVSGVAKNHYPPSWRITAE